MSKSWRSVATASIALAIWGSSARSFDHGEYGNVPDNVRSWFKNLHNSQGTVCCDVADGHRTTWRANEKIGGYEVLIEDQWVPVPPETVIYNSGNPTNESLVWYYAHYNGEGVKYIIRCFVEGGGI
jgi:hypothetical protein